MLNNGDILISCTSLEPINYYVSINYGQTSRVLLCRKRLREPWPTSLLFIDIFSQKLPKDIRDALVLELGAMDLADISKLIGTLERQQGALMCGETSYFVSPRRRAPVIAAVAQVQEESIRSGGRKVSPHRMQSASSAL